jgi:predicted methyltransferase
MSPDQIAESGPVRIRTLIAVVAVAARFAIAGVLAAALTQAPDSEADRERWQRTPEIFEAMRVQPGAAVADVGAGSGHFTARLARAVTPQGRVYAVDVSERELKRLSGRAEKEALTNVTVVAGEVDDPKLPAGAIDAILIVKAYHEMAGYRAMLARMREALKPGGRLVIVDQIGQSRRDATRERQVDSHEIAASFVEKDLREAGYEIIAIHDPFIEKDDDGDQQWMIVAERPRR